MAQSTRLSVWGTPGNSNASSTSPETVFLYSDGAVFGSAEIASEESQPPATNVSESVLSELSPSSRSQASLPSSTSIANLAALGGSSGTVLSQDPSAEMLESFMAPGQRQMYSDAAMTGFGAQRLRLRLDHSSRVRRSNVAAAASGASAAGQGSGSVPITPGRARARVQTSFPSASNATTYPSGPSSSHVNFISAVSNAFSY